MAPTRILGLTVMLIILKLTTVTMEKMMTVMTLVILFTYKLRQRQAGPTHGRKLPDLLHSMVFDHLNYNLQSHKLVQLATQLTQHRGFPRQIPP